MLQRAASNAYSWWWASHIRTKQSKWLEQNLQDMDENVKQTLKLIDEDGDSFAKRAEMYYRKRPELINFVEEFYRAYRALAERYDHISGELQNANHTIATVFPEQVQLAMEDEEDDEEDSSSKASTCSPGSSKLSKGAVEVPKSNIPKVPEIPMEKTKGLTALLTKKVQEKTTTTSTSSTSTTSKSSGMSKPEALGEIDKLQKGILALQTEKEFLKSSCEIGLAKYWEIEKQITEMQEKVFSLQDEFSIGTVIEDDEARNLMAATALKSCEETLIQLQEKQERSAEEARAEYQRVKDAHKKLETLKDEFLHDKTGSNQFSDGDKSMNAAPELKNVNQEVSNIKHEKQELELSRENIMEKLEASSNTPLTVTEMAERIDELVNKVFTLEHAISSQTALIKRLRSETDDLHAHIRSLEDGKATLTEGSNALSNKLKELEEELHGIQDLNHNVENQNSNLQTHFSEAHCKLNYLSQKLQTVKPDEDAEIAGSFQEVGILDFETPEEFERQQDIMTPTDGSMIQNDKDEVQNHTEVGENILKLQDPRNDKDEVHNHTEVGENILKLQDPSPTSTEQQEDLGQSKVSNNLDDLSENCQHSKKQDEVEKQNSPKIVNNIPEIELPKQLTEQDEPNWKQLFLNGLEDREKILLGEYTSILRNYKELKKKLSEVEKKNRDSLFEVNVQMRELKSANAMKDDEIQSLHQKLNILAMNSDENISNGAIESKEIPHDCRDKKSRPQLSNISSFNSELQLTFDFSDDRNVESTARINALAATEATEIPPMEEEEVKVIFVDETHGVSTTEEKFRMDIDALLEENLDFWLRFSTSFHQIQKFQTGIQDLQAELSKLKENKKQDGSTNQTDRSLKSDVKPIYKHLREIQTELTLWLEQNALLKEELQYRFSSLCNIQEEIARVTKASSGAQEVEFTSYQAAKFQGEVLNMKQENNKVADELQAGLDHVKGLQVELERTLSKLNEDLGLSESKNHHHFHFHMRNSTSRPRIPLRSFLFGVKSKKPKPSIFSCMNPALQKQYSDLRAGIPM